MTDKYADRDNFSEIIRQKLENYSLPVAADSWEEIEKRLNAKPKRKIALWSWISGVSVAASIVGTILFFQQTTNNNSNYGTTSLSYHAERLTESLSEEENLPSVFLPTVQTQPEKSEKRRSHQEVPAPEEFALREYDVVSSEETSQEDIQQFDSEEINSSQSLPANPNYRRENLLIQDFAAPLKPKSKTKSFALHVSSGGRQFAMNNTLTAAGNENYSALRSGNENSSLLIENPDECNQIAHYPPIAIGLSVRKALNDYLSVESGLTYTNLYSSFEAKVIQTDASLTLHYLGIPVNLSVNLYPHSRSPWNVYFSSGGMVEKGLFSHYVQNTYKNSVSESITTNKRIQGLQWSVQAALGLSYRFNRNYSVFLEPKIIYYLDNNQPYNIRTSHPFVPGINVGIRHTW